MALSRRLEERRGALLRLIRPRIKKTYWKIIDFKGSKILDLRGTKIIDLKHNYEADHRKIEQLRGMIIIDFRGVKINQI